MRTEYFSILRSQCANGIVVHALEWNITIRITDDSLWNFGDFIVMNALIRCVVHSQFHLLLLRMRTELIR